jgi:putative peptidoglycan lipid II flippase
MLWDLHSARINMRPRIDWRHPALRRILRLYAPIAASLIVSMFQIGLDRRLASTTGVHSIAWMANATTLQQMPLGLISVAIALAALPRLSQYYAAGNEAAYRHTLGQGLRMVLVMTVPAACFLWLAGESLVRLLFERGDFMATDTVQVARALNVYLIGMLFAAIDFPLNYAFYARHNTLLPAIVGIVSVGVYTVVAFSLLDRLGYMGLVWADTAKHGSHALIMVVLLHRRIGALGAQLGRGLILITLGAGAMVGAMLLISRNLLTPSVALGSSLLQLAALGLAGLSIYVITLWLLGLPEINEIGSRLSRSFRRSNR